MFSHETRFFLVEIWQICRKLKYCVDNILIGDFDLKVNKLNGMSVITSDAYNLGEVNGAQVNTNTWNITNLDVELTKEATLEFGFKKPFLSSLTVCLPITTVDKVGDVITLNKSLTELKNLEECKIG